MTKLKFILLFTIAFAANCTAQNIVTRDSLGAYRNEMIKGFGNAIVPQLVYRIFMAINQYMDRH